MFRSQWAVQKQYDIAQGKVPVFWIRIGLNTDPDLDPEPVFKVKTDPDPGFL